MPTALDAPPGVMKLTVSTRGEADEPLVEEITIEPRDRREVQVEVDPKFVDPSPAVREQMRDDEKAIARAYDRPFGPAIGRGRFAWPRPRKVTAGFGDIRIFNGTKRSDHLGLGLAGAEGAPVRAAHDGEVVLARDLVVEGTTALVHHGAGLYTGYLHLAELAVEEGDEIRRGQIVGRVGATGRTTAATATRSRVRARPSRR